MNEEDSIKLCWWNVLAMRWDCRRTDEIILRSIYVAWCSRWFFPLPSISVRLMLGWSRPARSFPWTQTNWELLYDREGLHTQPSPDNGLAPPSATDLFCCFHFGRERCQRSPFGRWLRQKGSPKDMTVSEQRNEIPRHTYPMNSVMNWQTSRSFWHRSHNLENARNTSFGNNKYISWKRQDYSVFYVL